MFHPLFRKNRWPLLWLVLPTLLGCGGTRTAVSGAVTYDGAPLANGTISFFPVDGQGPTNGGPISNGKYSVRDLVPGQKRVEITGHLAAGTGAKEAPGGFAEGIKAGKKLEEEMRKGTVKLRDPVRDAV